MPDKKLFNLHFEVGKDGKGEHYAKIIFADGTEFRNEAEHLSDAVSSSLYRMRAHGTLDKILADPSICVWPWPSKGADPNSNLDPDSAEHTRALTAAEVSPDGTLLNPSDLTRVEYPECKSICKSRAFFGKDKCKNMCEQRPEL